MKNTEEFIISDLNGSKMMNNIKSHATKSSYNTLISAFKDVINTKFSVFINNEHLDSFEFANFILNTPPKLLPFLLKLNSSKTNVNDSIGGLFKLYYLKYISLYETNSFNQYLFAKNVTVAMDIITELKPEAVSCSVISNFHKFSNHQLKKLEKSIKFEKVYREQSPLDIFISSLPTEFRNLFKDKEFIPYLVRYLFENGYVDKYGTWIKKYGKKSEIFGLANALHEIGLIEKVKPVTKSTFCSTFKLSMSYNLKGFGNDTSVGQKAQEFFKKELHDLYRAEIVSKKKFTTL